MAVSLHDGTAYRISKEEGIDRGAAFSFFLNGHMDDALLLYDADDRYCGMITYKSLLKSDNMQEAVVQEKLIINQDVQLEEFWKKAQDLIPDVSCSMLPVFNQDMDLLYFAKYSTELHEVFWRLRELQFRVDVALWREFKECGKHIHIVGMNDVLYVFREWLCSIGAEVTVEGELWLMDGKAEVAIEDSDILVEDEDCGLIRLLYEEYLEVVEKAMLSEVSELKNILFKPYVHGIKQKRAMFHLTWYVPFADGIVPLLYYYLQQGKECVAVFETMQRILCQGKKNIKRILEMARKIESLGGRCYSVDNKEVWMQEYKDCFLCSEYSSWNLPVKAENIVGIQTTAIYTHMYMYKGRLESVFSEGARKVIDYLVASEYIAGWISEKNPRWQEKILKLGYPKLDVLYDSLENDAEIPAEWKNKAEGKKVILIINIEISKWRDYFIDNEELIVIWRPRPVGYEMLETQNEIDRIKDMKNVIIDQRQSYYASFQLSDAMITDVFSSVLVNFLYLDKPVCICDSEEEYKKAVLDYRQEAWYKSADIAFEDNDVLEFMKKVCRGGALISEEQKMYRQQMTSGFDGQVCKRIFDYFEEKES